MSEERRRNSAQLGHPRAERPGRPVRARVKQAALDGQTIERVDDRRELIDANGDVAAPWRVVPVLEAMARRKAITPEMMAAGQDFHANFRLAQLDGLRASSLFRAGGSWGGANGNERARKAVTAAVRALGGGRAVGASCVWNVLGLEWSLRRWAREHRNGSANEASGVLAAALGVLAKR